MNTVNRSVLASLISSLLACPSMASDTLDNPADIPMLDTVVVAATKTDKSQFEVPQSVAVATDEDIKHQQATDISETLDRMAGVEADGGPYGDITIRGASRGQVNLNIDGVTQTVDSNKGMASNPLTIDPYLIKQVEVLKGGGAVLYGSGGVGGVVVLRTKTVNELLKEGSNYGGFARTRFDSSDEALHSGIGAYGRTQDHQFDYVLTADGYNSELKESVPSAYSKHEIRNFSGKFGANINENHRLQLNATRATSEFTNATVAPDDYSNDTFQLVHDIRSGHHLNLKSSLSYNQIERTAFMTNARAGVQDSEVERFQFDSQNTHYVDVNAVPNEITYGISAIQTEQRGQVNGQDDDFITPNGKRKEYGVFVQDTVNWRMIRLTGAARYVNYDMTRTGSPSVKTEKFLPSVGMTIAATDWLNIYASYSRDFRAPSIDDMYTEMHYPEMRMDILPNPDLKPETSTNHEVGFGLHHSALLTSNDQGHFRVTYFTQDVDDMIELTPQPTLNPDNGHFEFTTINVAKANRSGVELEVNYQTGNLSFSASGDYLEVEDKNADATDRRAKKLNMAVTYRIPTYELDLTWLTKSASSSKRYDARSSAFVEYAGYSVHGIRANMNMDGFDLSMGIRNLFDKEYKNQWGSTGEERTYMVGLAYQF